MKTILIFSLPLLLNIIDFSENLVLRNKIDFSGICGVVVVIFGICDVGVVISGICDVDVVISESDITADFKAQFWF